MAKVDGFNAEVIRAYQKEIDFYYWKGIPVARVWPDWSNFKPSAGQRGSMAAFSAANEAIRGIKPRLRAYYRVLQRGRRSAWLDVVRGSFLRAWKKTGKYPPVLWDIEITDEGARYKIWSEWSHSSEIKTGIMTDIYDEEIQHIEKKGSEAECGAPPFGPVVLDPAWPGPPAPPEPLLIPGELVSWEEVPGLVGWPGAYYRRWGDGISPSYSWAWYVAWYYMKRARAYSFPGTARGLWGIGGQYPDLRYRAKVEHLFANITIDNTLWTILNPGIWPARGAFKFYNLCAPVGAKIEVVGVLNAVEMGAGQNTLEFAYPEAWKSAGVKTAMLQGAWPPEFEGGADDVMRGWYVDNAIVPVECVFYKETGKTAYQHYIYKSDIPVPRKRPRQWYRWEIDISTWSECGAVPIPVEVFS